MDELPRSVVLEAPTLTEVRSWPATVDLPRAALALGISRSQMYALVKRGEAPVKVLDYGAKRVVTASLVRLLEAA
ncbi:DNA-binding protein [Streptomyces sp. NBC_01506]|uniref:DNA-binding protein n=1 Tax=Streptomyces sp. NBC_01506 TaxID=2903887 RepID=UPI003870744F